MFEIGTAVIIASAFNLSIRLVVHEDQVIESLNFEILFSCDIRIQLKCNGICSVFLLRRARFQIRKTFHNVGQLVTLELLMTSWL